MVEAPKLGSTPRPTEAVPLPGLPDGFEETFRLLNAYIDENPVKELTIYVHGAANTVSWSVSQGAQFQYFTGDNAILRTSESVIPRLRIAQNAALTNFQSLLDMQRFLFRQEDELAVSEGQVIQSLISLYSALGGGWDPADIPVE